MSDEANDNHGLLSEALAEEEQQLTDGQEQSISHMEKDPSAEDNEPLERPDFWPEKFWVKDSSEPDLEGIAKSYAELEKAFRAGKHKPPEGGEYSLEGLDGISKDDPVLQAYTGWAAKYGLSQQAFSELAGQIVQMGGVQQEQTQQSIQQEMEALGPNAKSILQNMATWARGMKQKGIWSDDDLQEFQIWGGTAKGVKALMKLRETYEGRLPTQAPPPQDSYSQEEREALVADPRYLADPTFRRKVERMFGLE